MLKSECHEPMDAAAGHGDGQGRRPAEGRPQRATAHPRHAAAGTGQHPKVVQERLGHSTITTTMNICSHVTPAMQKSVIDRFAAHLGARHAAA